MHIHAHAHTLTTTHSHSPSAGVGRTGTFAAIDIALQQAEGEGSVDIPSILTKLRNQRMKMVQTVVCRWSLFACLLIINKQLLR